MGVWDEINPWASIGGTATEPAPDVTHGGLGQVGINRAVSALSPEHPLFWFGAVAAVSLGLIGASTHLRVGPFRVSGSAGKD